MERGGGGGGRFRKSLLDDDGDEVDANAQFTVNENFAKRFTHNKKREDLHRLKELKKRGLAGEDSDDSDSEDEDEDGLLPARTDAQIFETLVKIKKKDPVIYAPEAKFYDEAEENEDEEDVVKVEKKKPLYLKDVMARQLLDGNEDDGQEKPTKKPPRVATYADEQQELKNSFLRGVLDADSEEEDDLLRVRHKTQEELIKDEKETAIAVEEAERRKKDQDISKRLENYFGKDDDLDENDKFLKNYLLNQGWMDKDRNRIPSYKEVVGEVSEDEAYLEDQDKYEANYNFRFQENAGAQVMGNPRVVEGSVRKTGEVRKTQRQKKAERLAQEAKARQEELKRLKNLKKKEIVEKLEKIRQVAGATEGLAALGEDDLEEDFDPQEYDRKMQEAFGEQYYKEEDAQLAEEEDEQEGIFEKPNSDAEDEELGLSKGWESKTGFAAVRKSQKVSFKEKVAFDKNLEEYYKLDYEDMVGDLPTRFKYRQVKPNTYGLDIEDILAADDNELNQHVSIKKLAPYRAEEWEPPKYSVLSQKARKKQAMRDGPSSAERKFSKKKYEGKQKKKKDGAEVHKEKASAAPIVAAAQKEGEPRHEAENGDGKKPAEQEGVKKSKKRRKMKKAGPMSFLPANRVEAYGALPTPAKKKRKTTAG